MRRYFVGIEVPPALCGAALVRLEERLQPHLHAKRWYGPEQFHLTLQFMGDLSEEQVQDLVARVTPVAAAHRPFSLHLDHVGWFPRAKVVWCGVEGETQALQDVYQGLQAALKPLGAGQFNRSTYQPHITLGRLQTVDETFRPETVSVDDLLRGSDGQGIMWRVNAVHLFESVSQPGGGGPQYPIRHTFSFTAG